MRLIRRDLSTYVYERTKKKKLDTPRALLASEYHPKKSIAALLLIIFQILIIKVIRLQRASYA